MESSASLSAVAMVTGPPPPADTDPTEAKHLSRPRQVLRARMADYVYFNTGPGRGGGGGVCSPPAENNKTLSKCWEEEAIKIPNPDSGLESVWDFAGERLAVPETVGVKEEPAQQRPPEPGIWNFMRRSQMLGVQIRTKTASELRVRRAASQQRQASEGGRKCHRPDSPAGKQVMTRQREAWRSER